LRIGVPFLGPTRAQQRTALEHLAGARDERSKKTEFRGGQIERIPVDARDVRLRIHTQATDRCRGPCGVRRRRAAATRTHVPAQRCFAVVRGDDLVAVLAEQRRDHPDERALVVDDEDAAQREAASAVARASGTVNAKTAPPSGASSTQISPPWPSTTRRDANRPMPEPGTSSLPAPRA